MGRGRRPKSTKTPTKFERGEKLREQILSLIDTLDHMGFSGLIPSPGPVEFIGKPVEDPKTGGVIAHVEEPLGTYIQRVSIHENITQRPPFDHVTDSIYRRLIKDFIEGAVMPESKVAALGKSSKDKRVQSLGEPDITYSIIDGLQRLYCFCIALLLVLKREQLLLDGCIPRDDWEYFKASVEKCGDVRTATESLLRAVIRFEIFYKIDLAGLLHYMVTFNTGQRRMDLSVQLEIMRQPLIDELERNAKISIWRDMQKMPGQTKPKKELFAASHLVLATQAFLTNDAYVTASVETERFLSQDRKYLDDVGEINDVLVALKRITTGIHPMIAKVYEGNAFRGGFLSDNVTFFVPLAAACGYLRKRGNMKILEGALDKLEELLRRGTDDPLKLDDYDKVLVGITASRGKTIRRVVYDTFLRFFNGTTTELEWIDTARSMSGVEV